MFALLGAPGLKSLYLQIPFYADFICAVSGTSIIKCIYKDKLVFGTANAYSVLKIQNKYYKAPVYGTQVV
jgi:hypothetical protein